MCPVTDCHSLVKGQMVFFPNAENWPVGNWQIATDMLTIIIRAHRQNFPQGFKDCITKITCDILKLRNKYINIYFIIVYQCKSFMICIEMNGVSINPNLKFCHWALKFTINMSVAICRLPIC